MKLIKPLVIVATVGLLAGCATDGSGTMASYFGFGSKATSDQTSSNAYGVSGANAFNGQSFHNGAGGKTGSLPKIVLFGFDKYQIKGKKQEKEVHAVADHLLNNPQSHVLISGYTDPIGSHEYNLHLGQRRADSAENYLIKQGVARASVCTVSYGELYPAAQPNNLAALKTRSEKILAYGPDRRVEFQYGNVDICKKPKHANA